MLLLVLALLGISVLLLVQSVLLWVAPDLRLGGDTAPDSTLDAPALLSETPTANPAPADSPPPTATLSVGAEMTLTQQQANEYLAASQGTLGPLERVRLLFTPGQIQADIRVLNIDARLYSGLAAQNGQLVLTEPRIEGAPDTLIPLDDVVAPIERQINTQVASEGWQVRSVRVEQGLLRMVVDP
jgi:hypothetical protein